MHSEEVKKLLQDFEDEQLQLALDLEHYKREGLQAETEIDAPTKGEEEAP